MTTTVLLPILELLLRTVGYPHFFAKHCLFSKKIVDSLEDL